MLLASVFAVVLRRVFLPSLELGSDDVHADELFSPFIRIFATVLVVCHALAQGTCELMDDDIDPCRVRYFVVGVRSIDLIQIVLIRPSLPELVNFQVCPICPVMVSIV